MKMDDDYGALIGALIGLAIIVFVIYCIILLAMVIASIAAAGGTLYGGGTAIGNYFASFKENMIDDNRRAVA